MRNEDISGLLLNICLGRKHHQHGRGKNLYKVGDEEYEYMRRCIESKVVKNKPIEFFINYSGSKNPNACPYPEPDESERHALASLYKLIMQIEKIYSHSVIIHIIVNDARAIFANNARIEDTVRYFNGLKRMIEQDECFVKYFKPILLSQIWDSIGKEFYSLLEINVAEVEKQIREDEDYEELINRAERSSRPDNADSNLDQAVVRFKASLMTENQLKIWEKKFPNVVMMSYRINPAWGIPFLLPWATGKGQTTQPWHGWYDEETRRVMTKYRQSKQTYS